MVKKWPSWHSTCNRKVIVAGILKVLLVNLLAARNFANFFYKKYKHVRKIKKTLKNAKNVTKI